MHLKLLLPRFAILLTLIVVARASAQNNDVWTGQTNDIWNTSSTDWLVNGSPGAFTNGDSVFFKNAPSNYNVTIPGTVLPGEIVFDNDGGNYAISGAGSIGSTSASLIKTDSGTVTLSNTTANGYTGSTSIYDGTLRLFLSNSVSTNLINPSSALNLAGGDLLLQGAPSGTSSQTFNNTTVQSGTSLAYMLFSTGSGTTLNLGQISRNAGGTVNFGTAPGTVATMTSTNTLSNGILGGWATYDSGSPFVNAVAGEVTWATLNGSGDVVPLATSTNDTWAAGNNTLVTKSSSPASNSTTNSVQFNTTTGVSYTITLSGTLNTITSGGILWNSNGNDFINGSALTAGNSPDLIVNSWGNGTLYIGSQIVDNSPGTAGLTVSGDLTGHAGFAGLWLTNTGNTYSGPTTISSSLVVLKLSNGGQRAASANRAIRQATSSYKTVRHSATKAPATAPIGCSPLAPREVGLPT